MVRQLLSVLFFALPSVILLLIWNCNADPLPPRTTTAAAQQKPSEFSIGRSVESGGGGGGGGGGDGGGELLSSVLRLTSNLDRIIGRADKRKPDDDEGSSGARVTAEPASSLRVGRDVEDNVIDGAAAMAAKRGHGDGDETAAKRGQDGGDNETVAKRAHDDGGNATAAKRGHDGGDQTETRVASSGAQVRLPPRAPWPLTASSAGAISASTAAPPPAAEQQAAERAVDNGAAAATDHDAAVHACHPSNRPEQRRRCHPKDVDCKIFLSSCESLGGNDKQPQPQPQPQEQPQPQQEQPQPQRGAEQPHGDTDEKVAFHPRRRRPPAAPAAEKPVVHDDAKSDDGQATTQGLLAKYFASIFG